MGFIDKVKEACHFRNHSSHLKFILTESFKLQEWRNNKFTYNKYTLIQVDNFQQMPFKCQQLFFKFDVI